MANQTTMLSVIEAIHNDDLCIDKLWPSTKQKDEKMIKISGRMSKQYIAYVSVISTLAVAVAVILGLSLYAKIKSCLRMG